MPHDVIGGIHNVLEQIINVDSLLILPIEDAYDAKITVVWLANILLELMAEPVLICEICRIGVRLAALLESWSRLALGRPVYLNDQGMLDVCAKSFKNTTKSPDRVVDDEAQHGCAHAKRRGICRPIECDGCGRVV
jgi:hypothetical protein